MPPPTNVCPRTGTVGLIKQVDESYSKDKRMKANGNPSPRPCLSNDCAAEQISFGLHEGKSFGTLSNRPVAFMSLLLVPRLLPGEAKKNQTKPSARKSPESVSGVNTADGVSLKDCSPGRDVTGDAA